jgi:hypothetical protein
LSQLQKSADAIARSVAGEVGKLNPVERRELLVQSMEWIRQRLLAFDASDRSIKHAIVAPTAAETQVTAGAFGKGTRSSDRVE